MVRFWRFIGIDETPIVLAFSKFLAKKGQFISPSAHIGPWREINFAARHPISDFRSQNGQENQ